MTFDVHLSFVKVLPGTIAVEINLSRPVNCCSFKIITVLEFTTLVSKSIAFSHFSTGIDTLLWRVSTRIPKNTITMVPQTVLSGATGKPISSQRLRNLSNWLLHNASNSAATKKLSQQLFVLFLVLFQKYVFNTIRKLLEVRA